MIIQTALLHHDGKDPPWIVCYSTAIIEAKVNPKLGYQVEWNEVVRINCVELVYGFKLDWILDWTEIRDAKEHSLCFNDWQIPWLLLYFLKLKFRNRYHKMRK